MGHLAVIYYLQLGQ